MNRVHLFAILLISTQIRVAADEVPTRMTAQEAQRQLANYWVEVEATVGGKRLTDTDLFCWSFVDDPDQKSPYYCWLRSGEAVLSECSGIGVQKVLDDGTIHVKVNGFPGLMKFDRGSVVIATPKEGGSHCWSDTFNRLTTEQVLALERPKDFTSTKENGQVVRVMKRTKGLYATEPLPDPKASPDRGKRGK